MVNAHDSFSIRPSGFIINPELPYLGASPDALSNCNCCGTGVVEIKCPYTCRHMSIKSYAQHKTSCLKKDTSSRYRLDRKHAYYYQIQAQLFLSNSAYGDFVVVTFSDDENDNIYVERVVPDHALWTECVPRACEIFYSHIMPELLAKWFTRAGHCRATCVCNSSETGPIIICSNATCQIRAFHQVCMGIEAIPAGAWICDSCRSLNM